jgi:hypothetical protein
MFYCGSLITNVIKLIDVIVKYVVIVANAAIHCEVIIDFKLDTGLGFGILRRSTIGAPNRRCAEPSVRRAVTSV